MAHTHVHTPHELAEPSTAVAPRERALELAAVVLLSLTTLATAWSGYQAARWSGEQSQSYARASATRIGAQRQATRAGQLRIDDLLIFNGWLDARRTGDAALATIYERRFRPAFRPAFRAWIAERPFAPGTRAVPSPLYTRQYRPVELARAAALDTKADQLYLEGTNAKSHDDRYVLSTVFFAAVLFFSGISLRVEWVPLRLFVLGLATTMLLGGLAYVLTLPAG